MALQSGQCAAAVVPRAGIGRLDSERPVAVGKRLLVPLQADEHVRAIAERIHALGIARNRRVKRCQSLGVALQFHQRIAAADKGFDKAASIVSARS